MGKMSSNLINRDYTTRVKEALDTVLEVIGQGENANAQARIARAKRQLSFETKDAAVKYKENVRAKWNEYNEPVLTMAAAQRDYELWKQEALASDNPVLRARAQSNNDICTFVSGGYYRMNYDTMVMDTEPLLFPDLVVCETFNHCFKKSAYTGFVKIHKV